MKSFTIKQGKLKGKSMGTNGKITNARGPKTALKTLFPKIEFTEVPQRVIFGKQGNQFRRIGNTMQFTGVPHKQPDSWLQLDEVVMQNGKYVVVNSYFYTFEKK